jgi:drug/metabolite transporter (DMT)-like permease
MTAILSLPFAVTAMVGWGLSDFIAKTIVIRASTYRTILVSQSVGTIPFLGLALIYDRVMPDKSLVLLTMLAGCLSTIYLVSFYEALSLGKASLVSPMSSCLTIVAVVLAVALLGETLTVAQTLLIAAVSLGMLLAAFQRTPKSTSSDLSMLLSVIVVFVGGGNTIVQKLIADNGHWLMGFLLTRAIMLALLAALFPIFRTKTRADCLHIGSRRMVFMGILDVSSFFAFFVSLHEGLVLLVAPIANSSPVITLILAYFFLHERLKLHQRLGVAIIIVGVAVLSAIS